MSEPRDQHDVSPMGRHAIHLGGAWQPPAADAVAAEPQRGSGGWRRSFGRPSGVGPADRVLLVLDRSGECQGAISFTLNAISLPPVGPGPCRWEHDVTAALSERNELVLDPSGVAAPGARTVDRHGRTALPPTVGRLTIEIVSD